MHKHFLGSFFLVGLLASSAFGGDFYTIRRDSKTAVQGCRWTTGLKALKKLPSYDKLIKATETTHWYLAAQIERELTKFEVCFSRTKKATDLEKTLALIEEAIAPLVSSLSKPADLMQLLLANQDKPMEAKTFAKELAKMRVRTTIDVWPVEKTLREKILFADDDRNLTAERAARAREVIATNDLVPYSVADFIENLDRSLWDAFLAKDFDRLQELLAGGASINNRGERDYMEFTPYLLKAIHGGFPEGALALIENSATEVNVAHSSIQPIKGHIYQACPLSDNTAFKKCVLKGKAEKIKTGEWHWALHATALMTAVNEAGIHYNEAIYLDIIRALLKKKDLNINFQEELVGYNALMNAVMSGDEDILDLLLADSRTNVCLRNKNGKSAYDLAVDRNRSASTLKKLKDREPAKGC